MSEATIHPAVVIGLGFIGAGDPVSGDALGQRVADLDGTHADALGRNPRIRLVAGSSRDPGRRARFAARTGLSTYADWREMIAAVRPALASIATYAPAHAEIAVACAESGVRALYCEKPLATRPADGRRMLEACRRAGCLLVVNHNRRFNRVFRVMRERIRQGAIGDLVSAETRWSSGRLGNIGTHAFDAVCMLAGSPVAAASGTLDPAHRPDCRGPEFDDPGGWGLLRLQSGLIVSVHAPAYGRIPFEIVLNGSRGRIAISKAGAALEADGPPEFLRPPPPPSTSMDVAVAEIAAWLDSGAPPEPTDESALNALEAIVALHASHERGGAWVTLPLEGPDLTREVRSG